MSDVFIRATLEGFNEANLQLVDYQNGLKNLEAEADKLRASMSSAFGKGDFEAANKISTQYSFVNERIKDLQVNISRITPDIKGLTLQQREANVAAGLMADGMENAGAAGRHLGLGSAYARRELLIIGREIMEGNFSRIPGTMITLAAHTGLFSAAWVGVALPVLTAAAAIGTLIYAVVAGNKEVREMNDAIRITGNFAGITRGEMILLSDSVSKAGAITVGTAKDIVTQIVASGRYGSENIVGLAKAVENYSHITGESIDQVTPKLIKQFESPSKAAEEYNKQYHTLSVTELERIRTLDSTGKAQEALTEALKVIPNITPEYIRNVGLMEYAWIKVKKSFSEAQQAMKGTFSQLSPEEQIAKSTAEIDKITARYKTLSSTFDVEKDPRVIAAREEIRLAEIAKAASVQVAGYQKEAADEVNRQTKGQEMVHKNLQYQNKELRDQLVFAQGFTVIDGVRSYNIKDQTERTQTISKLNKEISDNERSQYATTKAMIDGRIAGEEKLLDLNTKAGIARIETEFKLGQLTQIEADKRKGALSLEANYTKQMFTQQELKNPTLSPEAKQALEYKLEQQVVEFKILEAQIGQQETINAMNKSRKDANDILTATLAYENAEKDEAIKHNQQITTFYNTTEALIKEEEFKLSLIGKTTEQQTLLNASHRLELDYFQARRGLVGTDAEVLKSTHESAQRRLRVAVQANADAAKNVNQFWMTAAKDMQRSMSTFFFDVMTGNLASFRASFQSMLQHMLSDALAAKAMFALVGPDYMKSGNTTAVGGLIGQGIKFLGNMFGGFQGANDADLAMAGGGAFTVGGQGGTDSQMVKFKATPGERVMVSTPAQQSDSGGNQTVVNNFNWTVNALDARSVSQLLANPVTQRTIRGIVESGYNVNGATSGMAQGY